MFSPVWLCSDSSHGAHCQCYENLRTQLEQWKQEIKSSHPELVPRLKPSIWMEPIVPCPYCGTPCECDMVDVGVGLVQCGPFLWCIRNRSRDTRKNGLYGSGENLWLV